MIAAGLWLVALATAAQPARSGELVLDADAPAITLMVAGVPLRLRVDLDQRDVVELNPDAAARLPLQWQDGFVADLGGVRLEGRQASGEVEIAGRRMALPFSTHGRPCCAGVDGAIGPMLLPYATIRWRRAAPGVEGRRRYAMTADAQDGLSVQDGGVAVQLSLGRPVTLASRAAGVMLAERHGGRYSGAYEEVAGPFGVPRAVRPVSFARPPVLLGFALPVLRVRTGDFGGRLTMPEDRAQPGDIRVERRRRTQRAWPVVVLGRDQTDHCREIAFHADSLTLDLACAAPGPAAVR